MKRRGGYKHSGRQLCGQLQRKTEYPGNHRARLIALFLCLVIIAGLLPAPAAAETETEQKKLSGIVNFRSITLHHAEGQEAGEQIKDQALIGAGDKLVLRYTYEITEEQCKEIKPNTNYYLEVSPHLVLPTLTEGSPLTIDTGDDTQQFGRIYADGSKAWVRFDEAKENSTDTVLSEYGQLENAYFYLNCGRAGDPPEGNPPLAGHSNLYAMKFENNTELRFGYAENEPVTAKAQIQKDGSLQDKTITWTIDYTPWQNPAGEDGVTLETPFELRDSLDTSLHTYVPGSAKIGEQKFALYDSREKIPSDAEAYMLAEASADGGSMLLTFGGTKLKAGEATQGNPAKALKITYQTSIRDELLLPGGSGGKTVANAAELFAGKDGVFNSMKISSGSTVDIPQPQWLTKEGKTTRYPDGSGSTTDWTVTFKPNGFSFAESNQLTLHDQLPEGSELVTGSVKVNNAPVTAAAGTNNDFTVSSLTTDGTKPITITYQTHAPEEIYENGTGLGSNTAWFTFQRGGEEYTTPRAIAPVGSGDGSGTPGTATLVKENKGYDEASRTIEWTVKINPHQAYLQSGTFTDDLSAAGRSCGKAGHTGGLELVGDTQDIDIQIDGKPPTEAERALIGLTYANRTLTIRVGQIGPKAITLTYKTKVCDPCIFANNTVKAALKNTISTDDMMIGRQVPNTHSASADSTAMVNAAVLTKKAPLYDYQSGLMKWTVEVDAAGLPMKDIVLTDELPAGLTYKEDSLTASPNIADASASAKGQELTIRLAEVRGKTAISFDTEVDPERLGFGGDKPVAVENTIRMEGTADEIAFAEVSHTVSQSFSNHGLAKSGKADKAKELIEYEVLINPFGLALPENPSLVDTLDKRLQLDPDTLRFYKADISGDTGSGSQKPSYTKVGDGQPLKLTGCDPAANRFTVRLPVKAGDRGAYVLTYTADIMELQNGGYSNSVRFDGGDLLLGGSKNNSASVGGGGGGGGGGVAARKAVIAITKQDSENKKPLAGVTFTLYQWDGETGRRGLPFAQGKTDAGGKLAFKVKPGAVYELAETESIPGYSSAFGWEQLPAGAEKTDGGLRITAGAAKSELKLTLTNEAHLTDLVFRLVNQHGIPMTGQKVRLFTSDPTGIQDPVPAAEATVSADGSVKFPGIRRGARCFIQKPGGAIMTIEVPADANEEPKVQLPGGAQASLTADYREEDVTPPEDLWELTVHKIISGSTAPLAGAAIGLYADADCRTLIKTGVSANDGTITFSGLIKGQHYWLRETAAPAGYELNSDIYEVEEAVPALTIANTPGSPPVNPDAPGLPTVPGSSGTPDDPEEPTAPGDPAAPDDPGTPSDPSTPGGSSNPSDPGSASGSGSRDPNESGGSGSSDLSADSSTAGNPAAPGESGGPGNGENESPAGGSDLPQTGDNTQPFTTSILLAGVSLAIMILCRLLASKRRKSSRGG